MGLHSKAAGSAQRCKKLQAVARHWASGGRATVDETALDSLKASGAPAELVELKRAELLRHQELTDVKCWPENWHVWHLFSALSTQWETLITPDGKVRFVRLRYEVLDAVEPRILSRIASDDVQDSATLFDQLQTMEREALQHLNTE